MFTSNILITVQFIRKLTDVMKYESVYDLIIKSVIMFCPVCLDMFMYSCINVVNISI